ncbi:MAG: L,D-transpeptidase [Bifidobacteriaceae bacterium]|jgi:lipoprotein-anchoring transpeptidase ErfK/SrfK|nr:L,D-transpeptidase [Bifidobacteriaceae bacterium]
MTAVPPAFDPDATVQLPAVDGSDGWDSPDGSDGGPADQVFRSPRWFGLRWVALGLAAALLAVMIWSAIFTPGPAPAAPAPTVTATASAAPESDKAAPPAVPPDGPYPIAHLPGDVAAFDGPSGTESGTVAGEWWGYQSQLPVLAQTDGYLQVRLQGRPNESTAWIAADGIAITATPYRIVIDLESRRVKLLNLGEVVMDVPAIIGKPATPTPAGHFFVTMLQPGPSSGYGELVVVVSAHSETIDNWQGSGDAVTAIHGPLGNEGSIDTAGAISNGCVRLHMADLDALVALVPPGAPVDIE